MSFASYEDVAVLLGRDLTVEEQAAATAALIEVEDAVRVYTGQKFENGSATFRALSTTGAEVMPQRPLTSVTAWRYEDSTGTVHTGSVSDLTIIGNQVSGLPVGVVIEIDYTYGYVQVPAVIKGIVTRAALRALTNLATGGESEQPRSDGLLWSIRDKTILDRYRDRFGSIYLRP